MLFETISYDCPLKKILYKAISVIALVLLFSTISSHYNSASAAEIITSVNSVNKDTAKEYVKVSVIARKSNSILVFLNLV